MFTTKQKLIALSICHIFETSKPLGDSTTVAVLNDGAGISYGIPQATHKSGNLADVIERYIASADEVLYEPFLRKWLPTFRKFDKRTVDTTAKNQEVIRILREAGDEPAMRQAQFDNVNARMDKAIRACTGSRFVSTMALAVVYDSMNHGSWEKIRDEVSASDSDEHAWITDYVDHRDAWLRSIARLKPTSYRTSFFKKEIAGKNWDLKLPLIVHGFKLTENHITAAEHEMEVIKRLTGANSNDYQKTKENNDTADAEQSSSDSAKVSVTDGEDSNATANASVALDTGEKAKIEAVSGEKPVDIPATPPVRLWDKIVAGATAILTGSWIIPKFDLSDGQMDLVKLVFPYLMIGIFIAAPIWYGVKKFNNYKLTHLVATINTDTTTRQINLLTRPDTPLTWNSWARSNAMWLAVIVMMVVNVVVVVLK